MSLLLTILICIAVLVLALALALRTRKGGGQSGTSPRLTIAPDAEDMGDAASVSCPPLYMIAAMMAAPHSDNQGFLR